MRTLATVWIGIAAGIYGFDGLLGIVFYLAMDVLMGVILCAYCGFKAEPYFSNLPQLFLTGLMGNFMTFMVVWVLFHNLIYIL